MAATAAARFPAERVLLARTKLAYVHLRNLLTDAKRDRTGRVSGYVAITLADELVVLFLRRGEVVCAAERDAKGGRPIAIAQAIARVPTEPEFGEVCFHEASDELLGCVYRSVAEPPAPLPEGADPADGAALLGALRDERFTGVVELDVGGASSFLVFGEGLITRAWFADPAGDASAGERLARLFAAGAGRARVRRWTSAPVLPVQPSPALIAAYQDVMTRLTGELESSGLPSAAARAEEERIRLLGAHPALANFGPEPAETVTDASSLNVAMAAWMIGLIRGAMIDDGRAVEMIRTAARDRRHMLQAAGFLAVLPWTLEW